MPNTQIYTLITRAGPNPKGIDALFSADNWYEMEFQLETAGPVSVGTNSNLFPVLGGAGVLLPATGEPIRFIVGRGDRVYYAAEAVNRVKVMIKPLPFIERAVAELGAVVEGVGRAASLLRSIGRKEMPEPEPAAAPCPPVLRRGRR